MEEIYYIHTGQGRMQVGDEICEVKPGDAVHIPIGQFHELTNTGKDVMTVFGGRRTHSRPMIRMRNGECGLRIKDVVESRGLVVV